VTKTTFSEAADRPPAGCAPERNARVGRGVQMPGEERIIYLMPVEDAD
jgi:hypothetical protein